MASFLNPNFGAPSAGDDPALQPDEQAARQSSIADQLGGLLTGQWDEWQQARRIKEEEWLSDLRAFNSQGETTQTVATDTRFGTTSTSQSDHGDVYIGLTRTKAITAYSRIVKLIKQKHWMSSATPIPELTAQAQAQAEAEVAEGIQLEMLAYGAAVTNARGAQEAIANYHEAEIREEADERASKMERSMDDQLQDLRYLPKLKSCILEACILGTGALKGVTPGVKVTESWQLLNGAWQLARTEEPFPELEWVSVFDLYPDPFCACSDNLPGIYQRHVMTRRKLDQLSKDSRFDRDKIREILLRTRTGSHTPLTHETERRSIAGTSMLSAYRSDRYDVLEYWGVLDRERLEAASVELPETDDLTFWANVWTCEGRTLMARISPLKRQEVPYRFFRFFGIPHQWWGVGPPWMMRWSQRAMNGVTQAILDNAAYASLPMREINVHMLRGEEAPDAIGPGHTFIREKGDPAYEAVRFYQPPCIVDQLEGVLEVFRRFADEETSLPSYTHGEQTKALNETATGMSMLMGAADTANETVIQNLEEGIIEPTLRSLYDWNMEWNPDETIKGDQSIDVLLTSALMAKELQSQRLIQFAQLTANPFDMQIVRREILLRKLAESMDLDAPELLREEFYEQAAGNLNLAPYLMPGMAGPGGPAQAGTGQQPGGTGGGQLGQESGPAAGTMPGATMVPGTAPAS